MKPKPTIDPNAAGDEVKRLLAEDGTASAALKDLRSAKAARKEQLKTLLLLIWAAFDRGEIVNGFATRKEWATNFAKVTTRHCEHIIYGRKKTEANKCSLDVLLMNVDWDKDVASALVEIEQKHEVKYQGKRRYKGDISFATDNNNATDKEFKALEKESKVVWTHTVREVSGNLFIKVENKDGTMTEKQLVAALRKKMTATLKSLRFWRKDLTKEFNDFVKESADWHEEKHEQRSRSAKKAAETRAKKKPTKVKTVDLEKDLLKRFRTAKRMAKFYNGMMKELTDGVDGNYAKLRELYPDCGDSHRFPWTPPQPDFNLPKTEKEFEAAWEKAIGEFDKVLAESKAMGVLTDAPREKPMHPTAEKLGEVVGEPLAESCEPEPTE